MVGSKILEHYLSCPDGVSAYRESLPSAQRFAKKFDKSTHYLELIAAQAVTNKGILAALKPKGGGKLKEKPEDSGLESDVDTDKDSKNKRLSEQGQAYRNFHALELFAFRSKHVDEYQRPSFHKCFAHKRSCH